MGNRCSQKNIMQNPCRNSQKASLNKTFFHQSLNLTSDSAVCVARSPLSKRALSSQSCWQHDQCRLLFVPGDTSSLRHECRQIKSLYSKILPLRIVLSVAFHARTQTHTRAHVHTLGADGRERGHSISRQVLEEKKRKKGEEGKKKRSLAVPFPLTQRQAWPKHTGTLSSLLAIHIILSLCPLCEDTNFTTGPSSQPICEKIVVEREGRDTWHRLGLKASLNGRIPPPDFFLPLRNERQSCNYPPFFSICCSPNVFGGIILG